MLRKFRRVLIFLLDNYCVVDIYNMYLSFIDLASPSIFCVKAENIGSGFPFPGESYVTAFEFIEDLVRLLLLSLTQFVGAGCTR